MYIDLQEKIVAAFFLALTLFTQSGALAADVNGGQGNVPDCLSGLPESVNYFRTKYDALSKQPAGFKCKLVGGEVWERVDQPGFGEAWKNLRTGITWSDNIGEYTNTGQSNDRFVIESDAVRACAAVGGELPNVQDLVAILGGAWILPHSGKSQNPKYKDDSYVYWTKNVRPFAKFAYSFDAVNGFSAIERENRASVRCILRSF